MIEPDAELKETFAKLGIQLEEMVVFPPGKRPKKAFSELDDQGLLNWLRMLGNRSPGGLTAEIRKRRLLPESELRAWLDTDTGAA